SGDEATNGRTEPSADEATDPAAPPAARVLFQLLAVHAAGEKVQVTIRDGLAVTAEPLDILELEAGGGHCVPRDLARELLGRAVPDLVLVHLAVSAAQPSRAHHPPPEISDHIAHLREERCPRPLCRRPDRHAWVELPRPAEIFVFRLPAASLRCGERGDEPVLQRRHRYL